MIPGMHGAHEAAEILPDHHVDVSGQDLNLYQRMGAHSLRRYARAIVDAGVEVGASSTSQYPLRVGGWESGSVVEIFNLGSIKGAAGNGGRGGRDLHLLGGVTFTAGYGGGGGGGAGNIPGTGGPVAPPDPFYSGDGEDGEDGTTMGPGAGGAKGSELQTGAQITTLQRTTGAPGGAALRGRPGVHIILRNGSGEVFGGGGGGDGGGVGLSFLRDGGDGGDFGEPGQQADNTGDSETGLAGRAIELNGSTIEILSGASDPHLKGEVS